MITPTSTADRCPVLLILKSLRSAYQHRRAGRRARPRPWTRTAVSTHRGKLLTERDVPGTDELIVHVTLVLMVLSDRNTPGFPGHAKSCSTLKPPGVELVARFPIGTTIWRTKLTAQLSERHGFPSRATTGCEIESCLLRQLVDNTVCCSTPGNTPANSDGGC